MARIEYGIHAAAGLPAAGRERAAPIDVDGAKLEIMTLHGRLNRQTDGQTDTNGLTGRERSERGRTTATCQTGMRGSERAPARVHSEWNG